MKASKVIFLVFLSLLSLSLCVVNTLPVKSQTENYIIINSDGSISTTTNATVPIQRAGDVYTFTDNIVGYSLVVQLNNIVIDGAGYTLSGQGEVGVDLTSRSNVKIENMQIGGFVYGIFLWSSSSNTITGNTLMNNAYAISIHSSSQNTINGNTLTSNDFGVIFELSSNNILRDNTFDNRFNFVIHGTELSHFINDVDTSNVINGKKVYYLLNEANLDINPSTYPDVGYLALVNCVNITVQNLELENNGHGLTMAYTTGITVAQNYIANNYNGLILYACSGTSVFNNEITNNFRGVQLSLSSSANTISMNNITDNSDGIYLFDSTTNSIALNNITDNNIGIGFRESSNNLIRGNYFISNTRQVFDNNMDDNSITASTNVWGSGYPSGGNYWSDYTGIDMQSGANQDQPGADGLGDTPYTIYGNNQDTYPLLPFGSPPGITIDSPQNKTYTVTSVSLSFTVNEPTTWTAYKLDNQAQVEITGDQTLTELATGSHRLTVYARDADGLENSATVYFTITEGAEPPQAEAFPITWVIVIIVVAGVAVALLFYFMRIKKKPST